MKTSALNVELKLEKFNNSPNIPLVLCPHCGVDLAHAMVRYLLNFNYLFLLNISPIKIEEAINYF